MILIANSLHGDKEHWGPGAQTLEKFWNHALRKNALSDLKRTLQKGDFHSFAEMGRAPVQEDPPGGLILGNLEIRNSY